MTYSEKKPVIYSGEFYEIHYSPKYSANYAIFNKLTEVYEAEGNTLPDIIKLMFQLDAALMGAITDEEAANVEINVAKAKATMKEAKELF